MPLADDGPVLEAWTTLAAVAAQTTRVRLGTLISNVAFRHPAMLAKKAVTVHCISGGGSISAPGPESIRLKQRGCWASRLRRHAIASIASVKPWWCSTGCGIAG